MKLKLVGDKPSASLMALSKSLGIESDIEFLDVRPRDELVDLYRRATLFVMPSRQEGLGIVVLEAMACGLPVVSTRCGGPETTP